MIYLDTNIFIYASEKNSSFNSQAKKLLRSIVTNKIPFTTSVETFQEVIHYSKRFKKVKKGLDICERLLRLVSEPLQVDLPIIKSFLRVTKDYPYLESRDCIHLAICFENNINEVVSEDKDFKKVKLIKSYSIKDALQKYG